MGSWVYLHRCFGWHGRHPKTSTRTDARRYQMGNRCSEETQDQARGMFMIYCNSVRNSNDETWLFTVNHYHSKKEQTPYIRWRCRQVLSTAWTKANSRWRCGQGKSSFSQITIAFLLFSFQGVPTIHRAVINIKEKDDQRGKKGDKELLVEGYGLQKCMITEGLELVAFSGDRNWILFRRCHRRTHFIKPCHRSRPSLGHWGCPQDHHQRDSVHHEIARHEHWSSSCHVARRCDVL